MSVYQKHKNLQSLSVKERVEGFKETVLDLLANGYTVEYIKTAIEPSLQDEQYELAEAVLLAIDEYKKQKMELTPQAVAAYKKILNDPKQYNFDFKPLSQIFEITTEATAKHLIYDQYLAIIKRQRHHLPKVMFYIIMDETYPQKKAADGNFGYCVRFISEIEK